jgi:hypothetical protein
MVTVDSGQTASLTGLTVANGNAGGIVNAGTLTVSGCTVSGNSADFGGRHLEECTLSGNTAASDGSDLFNAASATLAVKDSTVFTNVAALGADVCDLGAQLRA